MKLKDKKIRILNDVSGNTGGWGEHDWQPIHSGKLWAYYRQLSGSEFFASATVNEAEEVLFVADAAAFSMLKEQLVDVLGTLTEREQKVLKLRFGLDDGLARTLEEVGKEFDVTRESIRQIEAKALRKLRHPTRSKKLKDYLE